MSSLFGLAPGGVYPAIDVTANAVRSYRTLSPLPTSAEASVGGLLSVALSLKSPPPGVTRHRVSVEPGLSSIQTHKPEQRPSDRLALGIIAHIEAFREVKIWKKNVPSWLKPDYVRIL